jgi:hypothetical protein
VTVAETGKGQHRGAKASANQEHTVPFSAVPDVPVWQSGFLLPPNAPEQEQSGAESTFFDAKKVLICDEVRARK